MKFAEPWEAQAYALAVQLSERGLLDLSAWTSAGGSLEALERVAGALAGPETLAAHREAWTRAAARTPHGEPIELTDADFRPAG
jgi:hypothetical protein